MDMFGPRNVHLMGDVHKWPMLDDRETWVPGPLGVPPMEAPSTSPESLSWAVPAAFWFHPHRTRLDLWANSTIVFFFFACRRSVRIGLKRLVVSMG